MILFLAVGNKFNRTFILVPVSQFCFYPYFLLLPLFFYSQFWVSALHRVKGLPSRGSRWTSCSFSPNTSSEIHGKKINKEKKHRDGLHPSLKTALMVANRDEYLKGQIIYLWGTLLVCNSLLHMS